MKKKIFLLTVLTAVFALLLCTGAGASSGVTTYDLWVNGIQVTSANAADVLNDGTVSYDAETNTLTLDGAELSVLHTHDAKYYGVILSRTDDPLTVNVIGDSKITVEEPDGNADNVSEVYGILHDENSSAHVGKAWSINLTGTATLDIEVNYFGSGIRAREDVNIEKLTLNIDVKKDDITDEYGNGKFSEAIRANNTLTIENGATVNVNSVSVTAPVYSENGDLVINDATVNVTALTGVVIWDGSKMGANPIMSAYGDVIITGNSNVTSEGFFGICGNNIVISGNAVVESTSTDDCGFWVPTDKMTITDNAQVTASGYLLGIIATGNVEITGGTVKAQGETNYAIYSWADTIIKNSIVEAISDPEYYSIGAYNTVEIESSWVSSNNGTYGAIITNSVEVTDGRGQAYGDAVLPGDVTVPEGYALVLREGDYLTIPEGVTLTNYGTVQVLGGCLTNNGIYMDYGETLGEIQGSGDFPNNWFVTVSYGNGAADTVYRIVKGEDFILPDAPSKPGYIFLGWRCGQDTFGAGDMVDIISNAAFQAVWANMPDISPSEPVEPVEPVEFPFTDVSEADWYYDAVYYVWANGVMEGVEADEFAPNSPLTRAMVWAMLARLDGVEVSGDGWVAAAQEWAVESGVSDGTDPTGYITREQLVTMLWRCKGSPAVEFELTAPDAGEISDWALEAMRWAAATGLIEGDEFGNLTPTATSTRAQAATFMLRFGK